MFRRHAVAFVKAPCAPAAAPYLGADVSIATKTGDGGSTALMYQRRVSKCHPRVEACGAVDELNAALGLARATAQFPFVRQSLASFQKDLVTVMGELATKAEDSSRYVRDGFPTVTDEMTSRLDELVKQIEAQNVTFAGWATPGSSLDTAAVDLARTICRRAERQVSRLHEAEEPLNPLALVYLNRLSDLLWLLARWAEAQSRPPDPLGRERA